MEIRYARGEDLEQVNAIRRQIHALHAQGRPDIFQPEFIEDYLINCFERGELSVIVAAEGVEILGYAAVAQVEEPATPYSLKQRYCRIEEFGVDRRHRRKGVATALMGFLRRDTRDKGFPKLELELWEFNREALAFYESAGFSTFHRHLELPLE